ncbi:MAG: DUF1559 domain-containing protein [Planctomycetota bacterium]|nr:DUF1559 domain-containing protein [Planctomycetota bacterium]
MKTSKAPVRARESRGGFTLVELLVVIAIIGILIALLLPAVQAAREAARRMQCSSNLKQIGLAVHMFHETKRQIPYTRHDTRETWAVVLWPWLEQQAMFDRWDMGNKYYNQLDDVRTVAVKAYFCPSRRSPGTPPASITGDTQQGTSGPHVPGGLSDYAACSGDPSGRIDYWPGMNIPAGKEPANGAFWYKGQPLRFNDITDGLSKTVFIGEKHIPNHRFGYYPDSSIYNGDHGASFKQLGIGAPLAKGPTGSGGFGSYHPGICQFVLGDGSVQIINVSIDATTLGYYANRHDGQMITGQ